MKKFLLLVMILVAYTSSIAQKPVNKKPSGNTNTIPYEDTVLAWLKINEWYCPQQVISGDREFNGNGPRVKSEIKIRISNDSSSLIAELYLWAQETKHDWSTTEGRWIRKLYDAPYGKKIVKIVTDTASRTQFITRNSGYRKNVDGETFEQTSRRLFDGAIIADNVLRKHNIVNKRSREITALFNVFYEESNELFGKGVQYMKVPATEGTLVRYFSIVGDTDGDDISTDSNCHDDTRIYQIEFFPIKLELRRRR